MADASDSTRWAVSFEVAVCFDVYVVACCCSGIGGSGVAAVRVGSYALFFGIQQNGWMEP